MIGFLMPTAYGQWRPTVLANDFFDRVAERVRAGWLPHAPESRNRYQVTQRETDAIQIEAKGLATQIMIGMNEIRLVREADGIRYCVAYAGWARYCYSLCLAIVVSIATGLLFVESLTGTTQVPASARAALLPIGFIGGILWPAILVVTHRRPVQRMVERILDEINEEAGKT